MSSLLGIATTLPSNLLTSTAIHAGTVIDISLISLNFGELWLFSLTAITSPALTSIDGMSAFLPFTVKSERDIYRADKLCSFRFTVSAMHDLVALNIACNSRRCFRNIKKDLPILMLSGAEDPVGEHGIGVWKVYRSFVKSGHTNVRIKLYKGCRHEIMHDVCKAAFTEDILRFIGAR